jgi:hypothetical protein
MLIFFFRWQLFQEMAVLKGSHFRSKSPAVLLKMNWFLGLGVLMWSTALRHYRHIWGDVSLWVNVHFYITEYSVKKNVHLATPEGMLKPRIFIVFVDPFVCAKRTIICHGEWWKTPFAQVLWIPHDSHISEMTFFQEISVLMWSTALHHYRHLGLDMS